MNALDIALALVFALSVIGGALKGFARMMVGFVAAVLAFLCAMWFYGTAGYYLLPYVSHKGIANLLGFLAVFFGIVLVGALVGKLLGRIFKWAGLSWLDRILGAALGVVRALVIAVMLVLGLMAFSPSKPPQVVVTSRFAPYIVDAARIGAAIAPREVREGVRESYGKVKQVWSEMLRRGRRKPDERAL